MAPYHEKNVYTVMVSNSFNNNKTHNHLVPQFIEHKNTITYDIGKLGSSLG